ncbi:MAG TPA: isoprenylcysteine carboxylmethyltransferase family protein [Blastocatellia bacterium]|nr:isoprenylcysteine carboxylmethyltransferase family protein [Blastocatellia bacterium]
MAEARVEKTRMTFRQFAQRIRVPAGFVLLPLLLIAAKPTLPWLIPGVTLAFIGLGIRAWASGYLRKNRELTIAGPYAYTRNPLYLGTLLMATGIAISAGSVWFIAVFVAFYLLIYVPVIFAEAQTLSDLFAQSYEAYSRAVPLFFPRLTPYRGSSSQRFEAEAYLKHREYRAAVGVAAVYALIAVKYLLVN